MPKFLYLTIGISLISLIALTRLITTRTPEGSITVGIFTALFFVTLTLILTIILYLIHRQFFFSTRVFNSLGPCVTEDDERRIFYSSLRRAFLGTLAFTGLFILKKNGTLSTFNLSTLLIVPIGLELFFWRKR